jgi:uncharacterized membrane protein required for colicin V production
VTKIDRYDKILVYYGGIIMEYLPIIIDIVFVAVVVILAIVGLVKGFAKSLISMVGNLAAIVIAILIARPFADLINMITGADGFFGGLIKDVFVGFNEGFNTIAVTISPSGMVSPELAQSMALDLHGRGNIFFEILYRMIFTSEFPSGTISLGDIIGGVIGGLVVIIIAAVLAFILLKIALFIIERVAKKLTEFSIIGGIDKVLGFVFGAVKGLLFVSIAFALTSALTLVFPAIDNALNPVLSKTTVTEKYYKWIDDITKDYLGNQLKQISDNILNRNNQDQTAEQVTNITTWATAQQANIKSVLVVSDRVFIKTSTGSLNPESPLLTSEFFILYANNTTLAQILNIVYGANQAVTVSLSAEAMASITSVTMDANEATIARAAGTLTVTISAANLDAFTTLFASKID